MNVLMGNGYMPTGHLFKDAVWRIIGSPNLLKRLQWDNIFESLDLKRSDTVLDFGCGSGYMTFGMARIAKKAIGIDVGNVDENIIPEGLKGKLEFLRVRGESLPFENEKFDVVLMSEVLPMIDNPEEFIKEVSRVLKKGGRIVLVNPTARVGLKSDYDNNSGVVALMKFFGKAPATYQGYVQAFQNAVGTAWKHLESEDYYRKFVEEAGYEVKSVCYSPSSLAQNGYERCQFVSLCLGRRVVSNWYFLLYPAFKILDKVLKSPRGTGCIMVAEKL